MELPDSECKLGYTSSQLKEILGDRLDYFWHWMRGQTMSLCTSDDDCGNHGGVVYRSDLERFLLGLPIID